MKKGEGYREEEEGRRGRDNSDMVLGKGVLAGTTG